jgi:hypothetical protein
MNGSGVARSRRNFRVNRAVGAMSALVGAVACVLLLLCAWATLARANATVGPPSQPGPTGLPDGRLYEEVSPPFKNGNFVDFAANFAFGLAAADGNAALYMMNGAIGTSYAGMPSEYVSRRTLGVGWSTMAAAPRPQGGSISAYSSPLSILPSADFERFLFTALIPYVKDDPVFGGSITATSSANIFLTEDPAVEPLWLSRPSIADPIPALGKNQVAHDYVIAGAAPDLSAVYFAYSGTLLPEDAQRAPYVGSGQAENGAPWGFYEWSAGALREAGTLPDGSLSPFGAVPAAIGDKENGRDGSKFQSSMFDNEVSEDGRRAFFVSPDPLASTVTDSRGCAQVPATSCTGEPPELYVRETEPNGSHIVKLVSQSQLPGQEGQAAQHGPAPITNAPLTEQAADDTYAFASPDGSRVFFASTDRLTSPAPEDAAVKRYELDLKTGVLTYLPGVSGPIVSVSSSGSDLIFENTSTTPFELESWTGPGLGQVSTVAALPEAVPNLASAGEQTLNVDESHVSSDGHVFLFRTNAQIPGFNDGNGFEQAYRYDVVKNELDCVSCPPSGVAPSGSARMTYDNNGEKRANGFNSVPMTTLETRVMSADGTRVFFDTPDPLVAQDTNGRRDVYEWENGTIHLISSGSSSEDSFYLDSSSSGGDVFFATGEGLTPGDADGAYDVYDARIPRPGDSAPPSQAPCKGSVCQGPPSVPQLLGAPASETFAGTGNVHLVPAKAKAKPRSHAPRRSKHRGKKKKKKKPGSVHRRAAKSDRRGM